jgi:hypothetical protein
MEQDGPRAVTKHMRASNRLAQLAVVAVALSAAGCGAAGGSAPPATPHVSVSISAPTSGATVGVHKVTITGTVTPAGAQVAVNGQPAKVSGSSFTGTLYVSAPNQKIVVSGSAHGYAASQASATVSYSSGLAKQIVAAATSAANASPGIAASPASQLSQAFGLRSGGSSTDVSHSFTLSQTTGNQLPSSTGGSTGSTQPSNSSPVSTPPASTSPPVSTTPPASTPAPAPTPAQITAAIRSAWIHGCVHAPAGSDVVPYCTCTYNRLAGQLQTRAAAEHLIKEIEPYVHTGDFRRLPKVVQRAVAACISKLPPLDPLTGKPVVTKLPAGTHGAASAPAQTGTDPAGTPVAPAPVTPVPNLHSALTQFNAAFALGHPLSARPAYARSVGETNGRPTETGLAAARTIAHALGYAIVWVARHDRSGAYPYGYRVQRRLHQRLAAALKLAA